MGPELGASGGMIQVNATDPFAGISEAVNKLGGYREGLILHVSPAFRYEAFRRMLVFPPDHVPTPEQMAGITLREKYACEMTLSGVPGMCVDGLHKNGCIAQITENGEVLGTVTLPIPDFYR